MTHARVVHCLSIVGNAKTHHVISVSMDGLMCTWSLESLKEPLERIELKLPSFCKLDEMTPISMTFPSDSINSFLIGSEEGTIYHADRFEDGQIKAGISPLDIYRGHEGPIFGLQFYNFNDLAQLKDVFISCGADFTVRLWRSKVSEKNRWLKLIEVSSHLIGEQFRCMLRICRRKQ
jgi:dynein intermediate chain